MPDSPAFRHKKNCTKVDVYTHSWHCGAYTLQVHTAGILQNVRPLLLNLLYDTNKSLVNAGILEYRKKVSPASAFLPVVNFVSPASVFWHQGQSGTAGHGLVRHGLALLVG
jgi:hypothetical protein